MWAPLFPVGHGGAWGAPEGSQLLVGLPLGLSHTGWDHHRAHCLTAWPPALSPQSAPSRHLYHQASPSLCIPSRQRWQPFKRRRSSPRHTQL